MSSSFHSRQSILGTFPDGIHAPISYTFANAAARLASGPYVQHDGYKLALDIDTNEISILYDWSTASWQSLGSDVYAIHNNVSNEINSITPKTSPISGDILLIEDSASSFNKKKVSIGSLPYVATTDHAALRQLIHLADGVGGPFEGFAPNAYRVTTGFPFVNSVIWYIDNSLANKIVEKTILYNSNSSINVLVYKVYSPSNVLLTTVTDTIIYNAGTIFESSRTRTII